ncbi:uncharacterized protein [Arachis hypogaea]|uniref:uncharacterized protein isoform X3 n=1 Tax=Arachis hypogaea TaxID=3818 RepID=UPI00078683C4|nr:uncharacterized protein LOC112711445 isoform X2 [Arachis hypogaea]
MQLGGSTKAAISRRHSSTSSHRRCYSFGATSPLFAAHPPPFWPSFCVCFLANPCSALFGQPLFELLSPLFSPLRRVFEPLFRGLSATVPPLSASIQPSPSRFRAPPFLFLVFRFEIVNGVIEVEGIAEEKTAGAEEDEEKGVPAFWLNAMKNNQVLADEGNGPRD